MTPPPRTGRELGLRLIPAGRGAGVRMVEEGRGRKVPLEGITLDPTKNWEQVEDGKRENRTGKIRNISRKELLWVAQHGREEQMISGGRRAGAPSRWTVAL